MLAKLFSWVSRRSASPVPIRAKTQHAVSLWEDTGQVYYLENTLKLSYQSNSGAVTLERVALNDLPKVLAQIAAFSTGDSLGQASAANQTSAFTISLCAVTWQQKDDKTRIKAIPDAAILRSTSSCFSRSQAVFRHAFLLEHDDLLSPTLTHGKAGVFTYNRISIEQFTQQIAEANAQVMQHHQRSINVKPENFTKVFSEHETQQIEQLLGAATDTTAKEIKGDG